MKTTIRIGMKNWWRILFVGILTTSVVYATNKKILNEANGSQNLCRCQPEDDCWPRMADWQTLNELVQGRLIKVSSPLEPCKLNATSEACKQVKVNLKNPFFLETQPGITQYAGWLGAWQAAASKYAVVAENAQDVAAAVNFANKFNLRLVIKGTGHDYLGRSNADNSLLIWTHKMRGIKTHEAFTPTGCENRLAGVPAVTVEAGTRWLEVYQEVTTKQGHYVQGGGCTSVGAAGGFMQGGGFGFFAKKYGTGADNMLEAEVVTADGKILVANACQNKELFWALRGGGGGTFGVVTKMTMKVHPLPRTVGIVRGNISAKTDKGFEDLLDHFIRDYHKNLNNEHWGIIFSISENNTIDI